MSVRSTEHAEFWVTILYGINACGTVTMPTVIHKAGSETSMPGNVPLNLDPRFKVKVMLFL